jgi:SAM-dependent methyltransferase
MKLCLSCRTSFSGKSWACPSCGNGPDMVDGFPAFAPELAALNDSTPEGAHHRLDAMQAGSFWFRARNRLIQDLVRRYFGDVEDVLEIGCGSGFVLSGIRTVLPVARLVAAEAYVHGLPYAARRVSPPCEFLQMDARALPFSDEFDLVGAFDVLEHIDEQEIVIAEIARALRPGGGLLMTVPQHRWLWSRFDDISLHRRRYAPGKLARLLRQQGFDVLRETSFVCFLLPLMMLQRLSVARRKNYDPAAEFALPTVVARGLEMVLDVERRLIRLGLRLPLGGSQVIVARKAA